MCGCTLRHVAGSPSSSSTSGSKMCANMESFSISPRRIALYIFNISTNGAVSLSDAVVITTVKGLSRAPIEEVNTFFNAALSACEYSSTITMLALSPSNLSGLEARQRAKEVFPFMWLYMISRLILKCLNFGSRDFKILRISSKQTFA